MKKSTAINWVKVIAILGWISAAVYFIVGLFALFGGTFLATLIQAFGEGVFAGLVGAAVIVFGIVFLALGVFIFFVARGLWKHENWARIVMIVISILIGIISGLASITSGVGVVGLIINGGIFYLLTFQKEVVALFK